jgi:pyruvate decarboxylase
MDASYNDIQQWKYKDLVDVFGASPKDSKTFQVKTKLEAENLLIDKDFASAPFLQVRRASSTHFTLADANHRQFVEIYMPKEDAPRALRLTTEASASLNARQ